jgi:hypothetical protein
MEKKVTIYSLNDPVSGEAKYIGKTNQSLARRLTQHLCKLKSGYNSPLYAWLRKLGVTPKINLIEECEVENWEERERYWISFYRANGKLTNLSDGGITPFSNRVIQVKAIANRVKKKVGQYDLQGNLICIFDSHKQAADSIGQKQSMISKAIRENYISMYGFHWRYALDGVMEPKVEMRKPTEAGRFIKGHRLNVGQVITEEAKLKMSLAKLGKENPSIFKKVIVTKDNIEILYDSIKEASLETGFSPSYISQLSKKFITKKGYCFKILKNHED